MPAPQRPTHVYEEEGGGPPVVLLNGMGLGLRLWDEQRVLADEFRLIRSDARRAEDVISLLDRLGIPSAHVVAHSQAGALALRLALDHTDRVLSVVFVCSVLRGFPWSEELLDAIDRSAALARAVGLRVAVDEVWLQGELFRWVRERRPEVFQRVRDLMSGWSGAEWLEDGPPADQPVPDIERLSEVRVPVFVISGQEDAHDFVEIANMMSWWIPGAMHRSILGVGHLPMMENPREFNLYLRGFLRSVSS